MNEANLKSGIQREAAAALEALTAAANELDTAADEYARQTAGEWKVLAAALRTYNDRQRAAAVRALDALAAYNKQVEEVNDWFGEVVEQIDNLVDRRDEVWRRSDIGKTFLRLSEAFDRIALTEADLGGPPDDVELNNDKPEQLGSDPDIKRNLRVLEALVVKDLRNPPAAPSAPALPKPSPSNIRRRR